jgi:uncharacterized protein
MQGGEPKPLDWRVAGVLLGLLSIVAVALQGPIGLSSAYVSTDATVARQVSPELAAQLAAFADRGVGSSPEWFIALGVLVGAFRAARPWRRRRTAAVALTSGQRRGVRFAAAFVGGFLLLFGARLAGGCTTGHVISGLSQLAVSGLVFAAATFAAGVPTALLLYRRRSR